MSAPTARAWLVVLHFPPEGVSEPSITSFANITTLEGLLHAVAEGRAALPRWPLRTPLPSWNAADPFAWFADATLPYRTFRAEPHLVQCVLEQPDGTLIAHYLFDAVYAHAHPQVLDDEHLSLLYGFVLAKLFDEGVLVLDSTAIDASLRWVSAETRGVRLTRDGSRKRG